MWIRSLTDLFDEYATARDDNKKVLEPVAVGASLAFESVKGDIALSDLAGLVARNVTTAEKFYSPGPSNPADFAFNDGMLTFRSPIHTETQANNIVSATVYEARKSRAAVIILPHWNALAGSYRLLCRILARLGLTAVELTLPYHGSRNRPGSVVADYFVSPNLGRTIRSTRQAVLDTRKTVDWLTLRGYRDFALAGVSMGSCIAGLVAAHDTRIRASALLLTAGDFAEVIWTSRATRHIKESLETSLSLDDLQSVWSIISSGTFAKALSRDGHNTLVLSGARDRIAQPFLTERLCRQLESHGANYDWRTFSCGHYSMGIFPFNVMVFLELKRFLQATSVLARGKDLKTLKILGPNSAPATSSIARR